VAIASIVLTDVAMLLAYILKGPSLMTWRWKPHIAIYYLRQSWPLVLSSLGALVYVRIDQVMLAHMVNSTEVGRYAVAVRLSETWYVFPGILTMSFIPALLRHRLTNRYVYEAKIEQLYGALFTLGLAASIITTAAAIPLVILLFGEAYRESGAILIVHNWAGIAIFMKSLLDQWLIAEKLQHYCLAGNLAGAGANVALNLLLIPRYGGTGAALATVISYTVAGCLFFLIPEKTRSHALMMTRSWRAPVRNARTVWHLIGGMFMKRNNQ
jgi:O-antigen/teichoic acid export membrane protein